MSNPNMWQFWIDVGGTFTDCLAQSPEGELQQTKVLSSGYAKGQMTRGDGDRRWDDLGRANEPNGFWDGSTIRFLSDQGEIVATNTVERSNGEAFTLSSDWGNGDINPYVAYELDAGQHAPLLAMRTLMGVPIGDTLPDCRVYLGTTRGTNALLTRAGARTALVTSRGLRDFLTIGDQARPHLFQLAIVKPSPLFETSIEIDERVLADGTVEHVPNRDAVRGQFTELRNSGIESIAVCLMHGYRYPQHENIVGEVARELGFADVRLSHEVSPLIKLIPRAETTVLDAYLNPVIGRYLDKVQTELSANSRLQLMTSAGGLVSRARFSGKDSVLSGPAGGVVGAARVAGQFGFKRVIGFDMGGTSTDVCRYESVGDDDAFEREYETVKAGVRIVTPMMAVETVAAGGGSICGFDGTRLCVGPDSAGADPGPACYGRGGPLAVTDINLFLGRIRTEQFPFRLNLAAVESQLSELCEELATAGFEYSPMQLASGFLKIANQNMSAAIRTVSVAKGYDPEDYVLLSFGGAGSQHCCGVADNLGMKQVLDHPHSSILSAVGIRLADQTAHATAGLADCWDETFPNRVAATFARLENETAASLAEDGCAQEQIDFERFLDMRFEGTDQVLTITRAAEESFHDRFCDQHQQLYGYLQNRTVEIVAARVEATVAGNRLDGISLPTQWTKVDGKTSQTITVSDHPVAADYHDRDQLRTGDLIQGPAIIADRLSTTIVDTGWSAKCIGSGAILLEKSTAQHSEFRTPNSELASDPVQLEIFNNHFSSIARQMGLSLQKTSVSVNVKERLDFSCAVFNSRGELVVNAPHIPVHLGAMSETVRHIIHVNPGVRSGDVFVINDPYAGGSHLPDITVVSPVFDVVGQRLLFWVASRSHHAEIGGKAPGSMPADAQVLAEEGVLIDNFRLLDAGGDHFAELRTLLTSSRWPSRNPAENLADLAAQVAANRVGATELLKLVDAYTFEIVDRYADFIQAAAEQKAREAIARLPDDPLQFSDQLDNGASIAVTISKLDVGVDPQKKLLTLPSPHRGEGSIAASPSLSGGEGSAFGLHIDFTGTSPVTPDNLNANPAIVSAAVMYVIRCMVDADIPLNEGLLKPVKITIPECLLNAAKGDRHPDNSPAVVGGNVETSQRVVDVLLGALGIAAASQGTMNNWLMGDPTFGYYETVGGGSGATATTAGADAVHTHMTNTRLTDPEILETRYPCVLRQFSVRSDSGGSGQQSGGNGMVREIEFTNPVTLSLLTGRRTTQPYGLAGGQDGASGVNSLIDIDGQQQLLPWRCQVEIKPGQRLRLETPGGGGFGIVE